MCSTATQAAHAAGSAKRREEVLFAYVHVRHVHQDDGERHQQGSGLDGTSAPWRARHRASGHYCVTEMVRFSPLVLKTTRPSRVAKIVSPRPMPAPEPGRKRVPRCRARIIPALTSCPSNSLTPSRLDWESRPFFEEPRPFLCAISSLPLLRVRARSR